MNIIDMIIIENPEKWREALASPPKLGWFVGQTMKQTAGKVHPEIVTELVLLRARIASLKSRERKLREALVKAREFIARRPGRGYGAYLRIIDAALADDGKETPNG